MKEPSESAPELDLELYFRRIAYDGPRDPGLATLQSIIERHTESIPFENLDVFAGREIRLDTASLQRKMLASRRGGYCFEQNTLLWRVLEQLGFAVQALAARVRWTLPEGVVAPLSHMLLKVEVDGESYLVDVGFGSLSLTGALRFNTREPQSTTHEPMTLEPLPGTGAVGPGYVLTAHLGSESRDLYSFALHPYLPQDFDAWSWFASTAPRSAFTYSLMLCRPDKFGRHVMNNNHYKYHALAGEGRDRKLASVEELLHCLSDTFFIDAPADAGFRKKLDTLLRQSSGDPQE